MANMQNCLYAKSFVLVLIMASSKYYFLLLWFSSLAGWFHLPIVCSSFAVEVLLGWIFIHATVGCLEDAGLSLNYHMKAFLLLLYFCKLCSVNPLPFFIFSLIHNLKLDQLNTHQKGNTQSLRNIKAKIIVQRWKEFISTLL